MGENLIELQLHLVLHLCNIFLPMSGIIVLLARDSDQDSVPRYIFGFFGLVHLKMYCTEPGGPPRYGTKKPRQLYSIFLVLTPLLYGKKVVFYFFTHILISNNQKPSCPGPNNVCNTVCLIVFFADCECDNSHAYNILCWMTGLFCHLTWKKVVNCHTLPSGQFYWRAMCESLPLFSTFQLPLVLKSKPIFTGILCDILCPAQNKKKHWIFLHMTNLLRLPLVLKSKQIFTCILCNILSPAHNKKKHRIFLHMANLQDSVGNTCFH
jgi:hypothetical protein